MRRLLQVVKYGRVHAAEYARSMGSTSLWLMFRIYADILYCYFRYKIWSNQYLALRLFCMAKQERAILGKKILEQGKLRDAWQHDFRCNRKFIAKYSQKKYEVGHLRDVRRKAYTSRYNAGENLLVEYDVEISRQHYLPGCISIGKNVFLAKHVMIDYSGGVRIGDNVQITKGATIETHRHLFHSDWRKDRSLFEVHPLVIEDGAVVGVNAVILPSCHRIGKHARVGAGAVVTRNVPDYAVVMGVPAEIKRYQDAQDYAGW